jgi:Carboxypeptidase regulatory-like domain/TonB-dependent Receptor Plug Domain
VRDDTIPPARVKVVAEWTELALLGGSEGSLRGERQLRWIESRGDDKGTFRICGVPINTAIAVRAEYQDGSAGPVDVKIPVGKRFARTALEIERGRSIAAVFAGRVLTDSTLRPIADADVSLPDLSRAVTSNEIGAFRIADVTPGARRVMVRRVGYAPLDTVLSFRANQTLQQDVVLSRVTVLDSVVVNERVVIPSFEENRRLGLGHFITRDQLAAREGHPLANVLSDMAGVTFTRGRGRQSWIRSSRAASSLSGTGMYCGSEHDKSQGMTCACYVQVYVDGVLMNRPEKSSMGGRELYGSPAFDVSDYAPEQLEAIEFYSGPAQTPAKYSILGAVCGVLVLWTRRSQ